MKHILWLTPSLSHDLHALIHDMAAVFGTPVFAPHITLLGGLDIPVEKERDFQKEVEKWAMRTPPVPLRLTRIQSEAAYFRCLYYLLEGQPDPTAYHQQTASILTRFGASARKDYLPHLSLAYGNLNEGQKARLSSLFQARLGERALLFDQLEIVEFLPESPGESRVWGRYRLLG